MPESYRLPSVYPLRCGCGSGHSIPYRPYPVNHFPPIPRISPFFTNPTHSLCTNRIKLQMQSSLPAPSVPAPSAPRFRHDFRRVFAPFRGFCPLQFRRKLAILLIPSRYAPMTCHTARGCAFGGRGGCRATKTDYYCIGRYNYAGKLPVCDPHGRLLEAEGGLEPRCDHGRRVRSL